MMQRKIFVPVDLLERMLNSHAAATEQDTDEILALRDEIARARAAK